MNGFLLKFLSRIPYLSLKLIVEMDLQLLNKLQTPLTTSLGKTPRIIIGLY